MGTRLDGKVALVTGGAMGLGESAARLLVRNGARVAITDVAIDKGEALARDIGPNAVFIHQDVSSESRWKEVLAQILKQFGKLNILVNNAGIPSLGTPESCDDAQWRKLLAINLEGTIFGSRYGLEAIVQSGESGSIIGLSSTSAIKGYTAHHAYLAMKGAVIGLYRSAAVYCLANRLPVRFNCILPGGIVTPMGPMLLGMLRLAPTDVQLASPGSDDGASMDTSVLGQPDDIGNLIVYLASDEAKFVNGQEIVVDSGFLRRPPRRRADASQGGHR